MLEQDVYCRRKALDEILISVKLNREAFLKPHKIYLGDAGGGVQMSKLKAGKVKIMASEEEHENCSFSPFDSM